SQGPGNVTVQNGGTILVDATAAAFNMGANAPGSGTLTITGAGSNVNSAVGLVMGNTAGGAGPFGPSVVHGGTFTGGNTVFIAPNTGTTATVSVTGTNSAVNLPTGLFVIGGNGTVPGGTGTLSVG